MAERRQPVVPLPPLSPRELRVLHDLLAAVGPTPLGDRLGRLYWEARRRRYSVRQLLLGFEAEAYPGLVPELTAALRRRQQRREEAAA